MPNRRNFRRRQTGTRAKTTWAQHALTFTLLPTGTTVFADLTPPPLLISGEEFGHGSATLKRAIMSFTLAQLTQEANVMQTMGLAMYVSTSRAVADSAIRDALFESEADWYYWTARGQLRETDFPLQESWDVDLKTQRRLREGYKLVMTAQAAVANTQTMVLTVGARLLWTITG